MLRNLPFEASFFGASPRAIPARPSRCIGGKRRDTSSMNTSSSSRLLLAGHRFVRRRDYRFAQHSPSPSPPRSLFFLSSRGRAALPFCRTLFVPFYVPTTRGRLFFSLGLRPRFVSTTVPFCRTLLVVSSCRTLFVLFVVRFLSNLSGKQQEAYNKKTVAPAISVGRFAPNRRL